MHSIGKSTWNPNISMKNRHLILKCIREVAELFRHPQQLKESVQSVTLETEIPWQDLSLANGYPGICLLIGELDIFFPGEGWDHCGHEYLVAIQRALQTQSMQDLSMWDGLAGVVMGARALSKNGTRYQNFIGKLNEFFLKNYAKSLATAKRNLDTDVFMQDYDVISGWSGIGRYMLFYKDQKEMRGALCQVLSYLVLLSRDKEVQGRSVPGWHISRENQFLSEEKEIYIHGNFNCGLSHGIPGPLSVLAVSLLHGVEVEGQVAAIEKMVAWLLEWKNEDQYGPWWPSHISWDDTVKKKTIAEVKSHREAWCYGSPGIARVLWLSGLALGREEWKETAIRSYQATFNRPENIWNIESATFCHGFSGLLQMSQRMETSKNNFRDNQERLIERILELYNPNAPLRFNEPTYGKHNNAERTLAPLGKAGLLDGTAGTILTLLTMGSATQQEWDAAFLLS